MIFKPQYICLILLLLVFNACQPKEVVTFEIEKEKMIRILIDLHVAEAAMQNKTALVKDSLVQLYYDQIFEIHEVEEKVFRADLDKLKSSAKLTQEYYALITEYLVENKLIE